MAVRDRSEASLQASGPAFLILSRMKLATWGPTRRTRVLPMMIPILKVLFDMIVTGRAQGTSQSLCKAMKQFC